jgi:hypothetical protein
MNFNTPHNGEIGQESDETIVDPKPGEMRKRWFRENARYAKTLDARICHIRENA